jgi:hypothetical protein
VRGAALKRTSGTYYFFTLWDNSSTFNQNSIGLSITNGNIEANTKPLNSLTTLYFNSTSVNSLITDLNKLYKVMILINKIDNIAQVCIENSCNNSNIVWYSPANYANISNLYIWAGSDNKFQWNDIIQYVKISR